MKVCFLLPSLFAIAIVCSQSVFAAHLNAPDNQQEILLAYPTGSYSLKDGQEPGTSSFDVYIDRSGTGHLQSHATRDVARFMKDNSPLKKSWSDRTSFIKAGHGWTQLTFRDAKQFWGEPRKHLSDGHEFYTFDAQSVWNSEANIYHLDLEFVMGNQIKAYRIRGIGIQNPKWINEDNVEAVPKTGDGASNRLRVKPVASP